MKTLFLGLIAMSLTLVLQSCKQRPSQKTISNEVKALAPADLCVGVDPLELPANCNGCTTLDGVDASVAIQKINNFIKYRCTDANPNKAATLYFTVPQLKIINNVLTREAKVGSNGNVPDGVRFYFGCDTPAQNSTQLNVSIYMISTKTRNPTDGSKSAHENYYDHSGALNSSINGVESNRTDVGGNYNLYSSSFSESPCTNEPASYVPDDIAHRWVWNYRFKRADPMNTVSEWFSLCTIQYFFNTITKFKNFGGLRVYLALGDNPNDETKLRDIVLLVPTDSDAHDYYGCVGDLSEFPSSCDADTNKWYKNIRSLYSEREKEKYWKKQTYPFVYFDGGGGGYDKGELCPTICN